MKGQIALNTILTNEITQHTCFYQSILEFQLLQDTGQFVELVNPGVRFVIFPGSVRESATKNAVYHEPQSGQSFELAFPLSSAAKVDQAYAVIIG